MMFLACCYNDPDMLIDPDTIYPTRADCQDVPKSRFKPQPRRTLSPRRWKLLFNEEGCLDAAGMIKRVQRGGIHPNIKGEVWEYLLGCYDPKSTTEQRNQLRQQRRLEYEKLKTKCREMDTTVGSGRVITMPVITEDGQPIEDPNSNGEQQTNDGPLSKEVIQWKLLLHQIGLDVNRTDRTLVYYESQENLARLWDILAVYAWVDTDIGYCQGMSDLCSPISIILEHEADAFWCFERLMRRVRENFKSTSTSIGVRSQLTTLSTIMKAVDPKLHEHLENLDGGEYLFAFRMLMVLFRREFTFIDTMYLWELMWSMEYNPGLFTMLESKTGASNAKDDNTLKQCGKFEQKKLQAAKKEENIPLSVFVVASVIEAKNKRLMGEAKGLDDVVKILNEITGSIDAKKACRGALTIQEKYLVCCVRAFAEPAAKEPEIQIGNPTDVKHVAHIGWDNNNVTNPAWMNEFKAQPGASGSGGPEGAGANQPSQPGGGGGGADKAEQSEKPRRPRGKGSGGGEGKRRPAKAEAAAEGGEGEASAAAPKQRRRKPKASGGTSSGRSKSSSGGAGESEPSAAGAED